MTSSTPPGTRIPGRLGIADGKGVVRVQDHYDTGIDDLWAAITQPARLARWLGEVEGDLRPGGEFRARFSDGWDGTGRYGAGLQVHVEDLAAHVAGRERSDGMARWGELRPAYQDLAADVS